jgi:hypothetical protein
LGRIRCIVATTIPIITTPYHFGISTSSVNPCMGGRQVERRRRVIRI